MTPTELRELDAWIDENVFKNLQMYVVMKRGLYYRPKAGGYTGDIRDAGRYTLEEAKKHEYLRGDEPVTIHPLERPHYTTDRAAAMEVLERCCKSVCVNVEIWFTFESWYVATPNRSHYSNAETLPLAICLFAKKLFVGE